MNVNDKIIDNNNNQNNIAIYESHNVKHVKFKTNVIRAVLYSQEKAIYVNDNNGQICAHCMSYRIILIGTRSIKTLGRK